MSNKPISAETHPRLAKAMAWQGILSTSEVTSALRALREGRASGCEAVAHYGGAKRLFRDSVRRRGTIRRLSTPLSKEA